MSLGSVVTRIALTVTTRAIGFGLGDERARVFVTVLEPVDECCLLGLFFLAFLFRLACEFPSAFFPATPVELFLLAEESSVGLVPLDVRLSESGIFATVPGDALFCFRNINVIDEVES